MKENPKSALDTNVQSNNSMKEDPKSAQDTNVTIQ